MSALLSVVLREVVVPKQLLQQDQDVDPDLIVVQVQSYFQYHLTNLVNQDNCQQNHCPSFFIGSIIEALCF